MKVKSLAYVGIQTKKLEAWDNFATDVLGLMRSDSSEKFLKFKVDERSFRIAIHTGKEEKLNYVGFELKNKSEFEEAKKELKELKVNFKVANTEDCVFKDVKEILGFSQTDFMSFTMGEGDQAFQASLHFLHCDNPRHHTVGLFEAPDPTGLIHLMLEVETLDDVGYALDRAKAADVPLQSSLGRHSNDKMVSFYMVSPSGFAIEYGYDGWQVDWDDFTPTISHAPDLWGHEFEG